MSGRRLIGRVLLWSAAAVASMLLLLAIFLFWLGSDGGRSWLAERVAAASDGTVQLHGLHGHPLGSWSVDAIDVKTQALQMRIEALKVDWDAWELLAGRLHVRRIDLDAVQASLAEAQAAASEEPLTLPAWPPIGIRLDHLGIGRVHVAKQEQTLVDMREVALNNIRLDRRTEGELSLHAEQWVASVRLSGRVSDWQVLLTADEQGGAQKLRAKLQGKALDSGAADFSGLYDGQHFALTGAWSRQRSHLSADGKLHFQNPSLATDAAWHLAGDVDDSTGEFRVSGTSQGPVLVRKMVWQLAAQREANGNLRGSLNEAKGALQAIWSYAAEQWSAEAKLDHWIVPHKAAQGELTGSISGHYRVSSRQWDMLAAISEGRMADMAASLDIDAKGTAEAWQVKRAKMDLLGVSVTASGEGDGKAVQLDGRMHSSNIGGLLALAGKPGEGSLDGRFSVRGTPERPQVDWQAELGGIKLEDVRIDHAHGRGSLLPLQQQGQVDIRVAGIRAGTLAWQSIQLAGELSDARLQLVSTARGDVAWDVRLQGKRREKLWHGSAETIDVRQQGRALLRVTHAPWLAGPELFRLQRTPLQLLGQQAQLEVDVGGGHIKAGLTAPHFAAAAFAPWLQPAVSDIAGSFKLQSAIDGPLSKPTLSFSTEAPELQIRWAKSEERAPLPLLKQTKLAASIRDGELSWSSSARVDPDANLASSGSVPWHFSLQPFAFAAAERKGGKADVDVDIGTLALFQAWLPRFEPLAGSASLHVEAADPLQQPVLSGKGDFTLSRLGVPEFGLDLHGDGNVQWQGDQGNVQVKLLSGKGSMTLAGPFAASRSLFPKVELSHFPLMNTTEQQLEATGHLETLTREEKLWLQGELTADPLKVVLPELQPKPTSDLVWEKQEEEKPELKQLRATGLDVKLKLADHASVSGRGMLLNLTGALHLGGSIAHPKLTGDLQILSGGIDFRNIHLDVLDGSHVTFTGDPSRPFLHVRAGRKVGDVLAGVEVDGMADRPTTTLFSDPAMSDGEILAYLATGRPLATLGKDGTSDAMSLAGFLFGSGSGMGSVTGSLQKGLGLDELSFSPGVSENKVSVGKKVGDKFTVRVEEIVAAQASTAVTLEYELFKGFSLFARQVQNVAPTLGLKVSREWRGATLSRSETAK